jgi:hypothetical protein
MGGSRSRDGLTGASGRRRLLTIALLLLALSAIASAFALGRSTGPGGVPAAKPAAITSTTTRVTTSVVRTTSTKAAASTSVAIPAPLPATVPATQHAARIPIPLPPLRLPPPPAVTVAATVPPVTVNALRAAQLSTCLQQADLHESESLSAASDSYQAKMADLEARGAYNSGEQVQDTADYHQQQKDIQSQHSIDVSNCHIQYR